MDSTQPTLPQDRFRKLVAKRSERWAIMTLLMDVAGALLVPLCEYCLDDNVIRLATTERGHSHVIDAPMPVCDPCAQILDALEMEAD